ncbi:MAG: hypothetical protein GF364_12610 [Candidatus Lokiarchaeota archaeon]|nr:hypothetical protein [Candidatus Lokiarchaeota archaeon]
MNQMLEKKILHYHFNVDDNFISVFLSNTSSQTIEVICVTILPLNSDMQILTKSATFQLNGTVFKKLHFAYISDSEGYCVAVITHVIGKRTETYKETIYVPKARLKNLRNVETWDPVLTSMVKTQITLEAYFAPYHIKEALQKVLNANLTSTSVGKLKAKNVYIDPILPVFVKIDDLRVQILSDYKYDEHKVKNGIQNTRNRDLKFFELGELIVKLKDYIDLEWKLADILELLLKVKRICALLDIPNSLGDIKDTLTTLTADDIDTHLSKSEAERLDMQLKELEHNLHV